MGKRDNFDEKQFFIGKRWWRIDYKKGRYVMFHKWCSCGQYKCWCLKHVWWLF